MLNVSRIVFMIILLGRLRMAQSLKLLVLNAVERLSHIVHGDQR